jgi:hypothetical protein
MTTLFAGLLRFGDKGFPDGLWEMAFVAHVIDVDRQKGK